MFLYFSMTLKDIKVIMGAYDIHKYSFKSICPPPHILKIFEEIFSKIAVSRSFSFYKLEISVNLENVWNLFRECRGQARRRYYKLDI